MIYEEIKSSSLKNFLWLLAQLVSDEASSHNIDYQRTSKLNDYFKSYRDFAEYVDFAYWWNCITKDLRLQPVQKACFHFFLPVVEFSKAVELLGRGSVYQQGYPI